MALLGQLLEDEPTAAADVIESDAFVNMGWLVGVPGRGRKGRSAISVELGQSHLPEPLVKRDIARGELVSISMPDSGLAQATLKYKKIGLSNTRRLEDLEGVKARIWVDGRGRPSVVPDDKTDQWEHLSP